MPAFYSNSHFEGLYLEGVTFNEIEANLEDYINRADNGDKDAQYNLSVVIREEKFGFERDFGKIAHYSKRAADNGHISAAYQMHILYHYRYIDMNTEENVKYLKMAADGGIAEAAYKLGGWYHQGCYVEKDENKSFEWYNEAAKLGSAAALKALKRLGLDAETRKQIEELAKAAAANDPESKLEYAKRLMAGKGVEKDEEKAKTMFFEMSQQGLPEAVRICEAIQLAEKRRRLEENPDNRDNIFELARMYHEGYPTDRIPLESYEQHFFLIRDIEKAVELYKKAILKGNTLAEKYYTWAMQEYILEKINDLEETIGSLQISIDELSANDNFNDEI